MLGAPVHEVCYVPWISSLNVNVNGEPRGRQQVRGFEFVRFIGLQLQHHQWPVAAAYLGVLPLSLPRARVFEYSRVEDRHRSAAPQRTLVHS